MRHFAGKFAALASRFARARRGVAAVEFALLAPVLIVMLGGVVELSGAITASNRATYVADAVAEMASRVDHTVTSDELYNFAIASALVDPDIVRYAAATGQSIDKAFKVTITSVQFTNIVPACIVTCLYLANVAFSYTLNGTKRSCGLLTSAPANAQTQTTLPAGVFGPGSLVVVDIETYHRPLMHIRLPVTLTFKRSSYFRPRYVARVNSTSNCLGF